MSEQSELELIRKENAELKAKLAAALAPAPVRPPTKSEAKAALESKYARECRVETPLKTRGGIKIPVRGSGNCPDHSTAGKDGYTAPVTSPEVAA